jgi:hypothetical protein
MVLEWQLPKDPCRNLADRRETELSYSRDSGVDYLWCAEIFVRYPH